MKKTCICAALAIFATAFFLLAGTAVAQTKAGQGADAKPAPVIAIVDIRGIMAQANAARSVREQIEKLRVAYQEEITADEDALRKEDQELNRQRAILSPEALTERRQQFNTRVAEVQRKVEERKRELNQALNAGMQEVQKVLLVLVAEMAKNQGYTLVLPKSQVVLADNRMEITAPILEMLNKRLPSVKIKITKDAQ